MRGKERECVCERESVCEIGVCNIYRLRYYGNCFSDVQFDNRLLCKAKQNAYRVHAYISLQGDEGVKQCMSTFRVCSFTA